MTIDLMVILLSLVCITWTIVLSLQPIYNCNLPNSKRFFVGVRNYLFQEFDLMTIMNTDLEKQVMKKQVLFIYSEHVVALGIENQLRFAEGLNLITIPADDEIAIIDEIKRLRPEVIIMNSTVRFLTSAWLANHFRDAHQLQIIVVRSDINNIQVFLKKEVSISRASDLVSAIQ